MWEDFRHGLFLGSKRFVTRLRKQHMPIKPDKEISAHRQSAANLDPVNISDRAARLLGCNVEELKKSWSWKKPFHINVWARVNIAHDVNITKMREKQHELLTGGKET